jgi:hypothetical protein
MISEAVQLGFEPRIRTGIYTHDYKIPGYRQVQLMSCIWSRCYWRNICLGRCSREVQLMISFGSASCYVLLVVNLFFRTQESRSRMDTFVGCTGATLSTNQNSHPPIKNRQFGCCKHLGVLGDPIKNVLLQLISSRPAYKISLNPCSWWRGLFYC